tara:strand:+ start:6303 stop:7190 length:888 start_codon:yes stop_codon:yes gene_type:complete
MAQISKTNPDYDAISYADIHCSKRLEWKQLDTEFKKLCKVNVEKPTSSYIGNGIIYHFFVKNMIETPRDTKNYITFDKVMGDLELKKKWIDQAIRIGRTKLDYIRPQDLWECYRRCKGSVNTFKAPMVRHLIKKYGATHYLDPTMGWGGRFLGAMAEGIKYTGIETNTDLFQGYKYMKIYFDKDDKAKFYWEDCMKVDFEAIDYDFVLTSPPYGDLEKYNHMKEFGSDEMYYKGFLIPLILKLKLFIKRDGHILINISNHIYDKYLSYGGIKAKDQMVLPQSMGGKKNKEMIYIF